MAIESVLQQFFQKPIDRIAYLDPGYSGHASDVWLVKTSQKEYIVRSSRLTDEPDHEFWWGCFNLFGIDPRRMRHFESNAIMLGSIPCVPAPRVYSHAVIDEKEYLVVEKMEGEALRSFMGQSDAFLHQLGTWLAHVHVNRYDYFGNLSSGRVDHQEAFHAHLSQTIQLLVERDYKHDSQIKGQAEAIISQLSVLPVPDHFCPVFIDLDPSQFLIKDGMLSAIVDVEAYAIGPRELDFVGLEYLLDDISVKSFLEGYSTVLDPPDITKYRKVYRYFYRLLGVQGSVDLNQWYGRPAIF